jgi:hypothetical protein
LADSSYRPLVVAGNNAVFGVDVHLFSEVDEARLIADLRDALSESQTGEMIAVAERSRSGEPEGGSLSG